MFMIDKYSSVVKYNGGVLFVKCAGKCHE